MFGMNKALTMKNYHLCPRGDFMRGTWREGSFTGDPERYVK
jgi:hypothetical protein